MPDFLSTLVRLQAKEEFLTLRELSRLDFKVQQAIARTLLFQADELLLMFRRCESPVEQLMAVYLQLWCMLHSTHPGLPGFRCWFTPQKEIKAGEQTYRVDFLLTGEYNGQVKHVAIECDGHEFHEKTKEQAARDKARDRAIQALGIPVLRFTGSEIWNDPERKSLEAVETLEKLFGLEMKTWLGG